MLRLEPDSERGWFDGRSLAADDAAETATGASIAQAAEALQSAFDGSAPGVTVALLEYEGSATILRYPEARWGPAGEARPSVGPDAPLLTDVEIDLPARAFRAAVHAVRERIAAGDVYVLNLTARFFGSPSMSLVDAYEVLRARAGSAMNALLALGDGRGIASVSPERFLRVRRGADLARDVEVWPIKGTRPRGRDAAEDAALEAELCEDVKERAEHVMVVDLERNDLGRVCVAGSVRVDPLYEVFPTPYCLQMVSRVSGTMRDDASIGDLLAATFPCGSVTGAPKIAAMRIAAELERSPRGAYCGALLVATRDDIDSAVLIRTLEYRDPSERVLWGAGCGITHDSDPSAEWLEAVLKASPVTGDGVPSVALRETMRVVRGRVPLSDRHQARLVAGGCGATVLGRVRGAVARCLAEWPTDADYGRLAITVTPDGGVQALVTGDVSSLAVEGGPVLVPVEVDRLVALPEGAAKPAARSFWDRQHRAARMAGGHQAVLVGPDGSLVDGSTATVWLVKSGCLLTPPAPPAIAGVARELVFDIAVELGISAREKTLTLADLDGADEVFLSNAVGGVVAARGRGGAIAAAVAARVDREWS